MANKYPVFTYNVFDQLSPVDRYANTTTSNLVAHTDYKQDWLNRYSQIDHYKASTHLATYDLGYYVHYRLTSISDTFSNSAWNEAGRFPVFAVSSFVLKLALLATGASFTGLTVMVTVAEV